MNRRLTALPGVLAGLSLIALTAAGEPQLTAKIATKNPNVRIRTIFQTSLMYLSVPAVNVAMTSLVCSYCIFPFSTTALR